MLRLKKSDIVLLVLIVLSILPGIIYYNQLPSQVPLHWNVQGQVNRYGPKNTAVFLMPGLNVFMYFMFLLLPKVDPRRKNYEMFSGSYNILRWAIHFLLILLNLFSIWSALRLAQGQPSLDISLLVPIAVSVLFIIIGNYMGRFRHNYFVGIRTPWTLANEQVWQKTHRLGGKLFVLSGVLGIIGVFLPNLVRFWMLIGPLLASTVILFLYSYREYNKLNNLKD